MSTLLRYLPWFAAVTLWAACGDDPSEVAATPDAGTYGDGGAPPGEVSFRLEVTVGDLPETARPIGPLRLVAEPVGGESRHVIDLSGPVAAWPVRVPVDGLRPGRYRLTAFLDRNRSETFDGCPFPPAPGDTELADTLDNVNGVAIAEISEGARVDIRLERHICGPGDPTTGLRGEIELPESGEALRHPVYLLLEPQDDLRPAAMQTMNQTADDTRAPTPAALRIPLFPEGLSGRATFDIGELVPGRYSAVFFGDADGDHSPTPCTEGIGGGDRFLAAPEGELVIEAGNRVVLAEAVRLAPAPGCPEVLVGVTGELDLAPALLEALRGDAPPAIDGAVRLAVLDLTTGVAVTESALLLAHVGARPMPHRFTVTGIDEGEWRIALYIDADGDGQFAPCGGLPGGVDRIYAVRDGVPARPGAYADLGRIELAQPDNCAGLDTGVRGRFTVEVEEGPVGSGRPVRLDLLPAGEDGERRSFLLFESHRALVENTDGEEEGTPFAVIADLPPGTYSARVYVDTDRDGTYLSCADSPYGDRATSRELRVELVAGEVLDLGPSHVASHGCAVPAVSAELSVVFADGVDRDADRGELRVALAEQGGWHTDQLLTTLPLPGVHGEPWTASAIALAPGLYTVTVYVDTNGSRGYDPCDAESADAVMGRVEIALDVQHPLARATLEIDATCPP